MSGVAAALLPVLLVLYPLLLLLDDVEPGFVRSVVNPHWFLVVLLVAGIVARNGDSASVPTPSRSPSRWEGEKKENFPPSRWEGGCGGVVRVTLVFVPAIIVGVWTWWRLHAGMLGIVVGLLAAIAVWAAANMFGDAETPSSP